MDNLVFFNIAKHADPKTAVSILHAGGPKFFKEAHHHKMVCESNLVSNQLYFDLRFVVTDQYNEDAIIGRIVQALYVSYSDSTLRPIAKRSINTWFLSEHQPKYIAQNGPHIYNLGKSFSMAAKGWGNEYAVFTTNRGNLTQGMVILDDLLKDGKIALTTDLKVFVEHEQVQQMQNYKLSTIRIFEDVKPYLVTEIDKWGGCSVIKV